MSLPMYHHYSFPCIWANVLPRYKFHSTLPDIEPSLIGVDCTELLLLVKCNAIDREVTEGHTKVPSRESDNGAFLKGTILKCDYNN